MTLSMGMHWEQNVPLDMKILSNVPNTNNLTDDGGQPKPTTATAVDVAHKLSSEETKTMVEE